MSKKSAAQQDAMRRAEARRRARLQAQGHVVEADEDEDAAAPVRQPAPPLLQRLFPPAAPLAGKPDPFIGFNYTGRLRPVVANLWLIPRNLFASFGMGLLWTATYIMVDQYAGSTIGSIASFVSFGSLVAAGWIGWQRPWLFGLAAATIGYLIYTPYFIYSVVRAPATIPPITASQVALVLLTNGVVQVGIGALAGFYGGYLRRRLADPATRQAAATRRRR
ncbi:MAG TPA: hypothetical protein VFJ00_04780 [Candidatus Limnocylindria bacterium]|nr:hypothetical protein [Candidatus Limnocylindria bacterium]